MKKGNKTKITPEDLTIQARNESLPPEVEYSEGNEYDAHISGYIDSDGDAVSMAKKTVSRKPTGALTDLEAGRSSGIQPKFGQKTIEDAPAVGEEQAP